MESRARQTTEGLSDSPTPHPSPHGQNGHSLSPLLYVDELLLSLAEAYEDDDTAAQMSGASGVVPDSIRMSHNQQTACNGNCIRNIAGQIGNITYLSQIPANEATTQRLQDYFSNSLTATVRPTTSVDTILSHEQRHPPAGDQYHAYAIGDERADMEPRMRSREVPAIMNSLRPVWRPADRTDSSLEGSLSWSSVDSQHQVEGSLRNTPTIYTDGFVSSEGVGVSSANILPQRTEDDVPE